MRNYMCDSFLRVHIRHTVTGLSLCSELIADTERIGDKSIPIALDY